jgi:hypothetical protein
LYKKQITGISQWPLDRFEAPADPTNQHLGYFSLVYSGCFETKEGPIKTSFKKQDMECVFFYFASNTRPNVGQSKKIDHEMISIIELQHK